MKKIGICTLYYQNRNYGANLQAYALQKVISSRGFQCELISYYDNTWIRRKVSSIKHFLISQNKLSRRIKTRNEAVDQFKYNIPHSKLYYRNTINEANLSYDAFVAGSDQIWNPLWINKCFSLDFVEDHKPTCAYAASTGRITLSENEQLKLLKALQNTDFISIREYESIPSLKSLTDKDLKCVLDPTLLLKRMEWDEICTERIVENRYVFCYFLGGNENIRRQAKIFAEAHRLKIVSLPYLNAAYRNVDDGFGDFQLYNITPNQLLSLIKYAEFVITDSFHITVFSHIFEKKFFVSGGKRNEMGCRMISLTKLFGTEERYIQEHDDVNADHLSELYDKELVVDMEKYEEMRRQSLAFLYSFLDKVV